MKLERKCRWKDSDIHDKIKQNFERNDRKYDKIKSVCICQGEKMKTVGIDIDTTTISSVVFEHESPKILFRKTVESKCFMQRDNPWKHIQDVTIIIEETQKILSH